MNPDIAQIPQPLLTEIQTLLGCDLRVVYQHL